MNGSFEIIYPGKTFVIYFDFSETVYPTFGHAKVGVDSNPHNYVVTILNSPTINNLEASVSFETNLV